MEGPFPFFIKFCSNGHGLFTREVQPSAERCDRCGEPYITHCQNCREVIPNLFYARVLSTGRLLEKPPRPRSFCEQCGQPFPWEKKKREMVELYKFWDLLHPEVVNAAKRRFESGHYADAVEASMKCLNAKIKSIYKEITGVELDGVHLMRSCFSPRNPSLLVGDLNTETGLSMQQGYMDMFAGAMSGIRNPKAHDNITISPERAIHHLFIASLLFFKIDESIRTNRQS